MFMVFVRFSEYTAIISLNRINNVIFVIETGYKIWDFHADDGDGDFVGILGFYAVQTHK
jgi:hypothetical protein